MKKPKSRSRRDFRIQVAVADKSPLVQAALRHLITEDERFNLVDICSDGDSFLAMIDRIQIDVAVIGWIIEPCDGKYILDNLRSRAKVPRIVVYTGANSVAVAAQVMAHGGAAYVSKSEQPKYLLDTVAEVATGRMVFPFLDVRTLYRNPLTNLTRRELEVLALIAAGHTNKEIAVTQKVSPNTIKFHVKNLFQKLGVTNRSQAIAIYLKS